MHERSLLDEKQTLEAFLESVVQGRFKQARVPRHVVNACELRIEEIRRHMKAACSAPPSARIAGRCVG